MEIITSLNKKLKTLGIVKLILIILIAILFLIFIEVVEPMLDSRIPVLMYHSVGSSSTSDIVLPKEVFNNQLKFLKDNGYTTLTLDQLYDHFYKGKKVPKKSVVLTFDDGYRDNYEVVYPLLKSYGFTGTIFMQTNKVDKDPAFLTSEQLKELDANGIMIMSHTVSHRDLTTLSEDEKYSELINSKKFLEKLLNKRIKYVAYPYGNCDTNTKAAAKRAGYDMGIGILDRYADRENDVFEISRRAVIKDMDNFNAKVTKSNFHMFKYKCRKAIRIVKENIYVTHS